ncbi:MAG: CaiB/BaiF CoA transferase family protein [Gammaproteobacteria bacterium]
MDALFSGIRVVEVATFVFAPGAGTVMGDFGAEVIQVEPPGGDPMRHLYRMRPLPESDTNYCWLLDARNKKSIVIDLREPAGHAVLCDLVRSADVFITNYQPSVVSDLGIAYDAMRELNPRLVYAHATGYGESGDEVEKPGYDATAWWARSGMMDAVRPAGGDLALATAAMGDHPSSISLLAGIAMALFARERTGRGTKVSSSLVANGAWANSILIQAALCGATPYVPPAQIDTPNPMLNHYRAACGRSFYLVLIKQAEEFGRFCAAIGRPALAEDPRFASVEARGHNAHELVAILNDIFATKPLDAWRAILDEHAITFGIIATSTEAADDAQMAAAGVFQTFADAPAQRVVSSPMSLADYPKTVPQLPPALGQDAASILESLGYEAAQRDALLQSGAVGRAESD